MLETKKGKTEKGLGEDRHSASGEPTSFVKMLAGLVGFARSAVSGSSIHIHGSQKGIYKDLKTGDSLLDVYVGMSLRDSDRRKCVAILKDSSPRGETFLETWEVEGSVFACSAEDRESSKWRGESFGEIKEGTLPLCVWLA